ncbi:filamentation induced by cAMP protein Fic [Catenulispora acidiphila DSM 44928]|uniref:Filamentation induced by cAMP protein Fic n=1 Tax=Catenulispora acidiphila (strain DSM 44928 / JCM 14897 / NBRC 102108 / NRRL B-24433 / ID139908) TaxID=479433 RepID=C7Q617_CATAD|nr:Fic family protein [Catenulispora acidiphila]ACU70114.1 filamentation induced by cAMP protein Fic [Catenulispora acidiphila DSM 44928]
MISDLHPGSLSWDEVDPSRHPFDSAAADRVVRSLGPARRVPHRPDAPIGSPEMSAWGSGEAELWAKAMSHALAQHYGLWALGWRWATGEGDHDGGPVRNWCCTQHSIKTPEETITRVVAALIEWREWLESLAGWFEAYPLDRAAVEDGRIVGSRAVHAVIVQVIERTGCASGWYGHCVQVLTWFLNRWGVAPRTAQDLVEQAIGGRFESWTSPDTVLLDEVASKLASSRQPDGGAEASGPVPDHLERWLAIRRSAQPRDVGTGTDAHGYRKTGTATGSKPLALLRDGAAEDIRAFDGSLDPARAQGLLAALDMARADAARGSVLDFELLRRWQQHVLNTPQPPSFRDLPAFAKGGRERYGIGTDTRARFDGCLAESADGEGDGAAPLSLRAARAYLDVCFFHPFDDGNARAAFLTAVFVLAREDVQLGSVALLRRVSYQADDPQAPLTLARHIELAWR